MRDGVFWRPNLHPPKHFLDPPLHGFVANELHSETSSHWIIYSGWEILSTIQDRSEMWPEYLTQLIPSQFGTQNHIVCCTVLTKS